MGLLEITVEAGSSGPVVTLSGESDLTTAGQLRDALTALVERRISGKAVLTVG